MDIPIVSLLVNNIAAILIHFATPSQFSVIDPFCEAHILSGSTTVSGGQMICSRINTAVTSRFLVSGFSFSSGSIVRVFFRGRVKTTSLTTNVYLLLLKNNLYYIIHRQMGYNVDVSGVAAAGCKLYYSKF